jgi:hypothetical protein
MAQSSGTGAPIRQEELDQMLAPIALYPDSLLGQILVAATYPDQVKEADRWVDQNKNLQGDELNAELDRADWDLSVKALVPFPQVLSMMSDKMDWTQRLGDAFLAQQANVMDTIQNLRVKAHKQGNLNNTEQQRVVVRGDSIQIEPANPRVIYVPTYNPAVIYGSWWYPAYPPYAYNPYYPHYAYDPYYTGTGFITGGLFGFAAGIAVGSVWNSGWGRWDWGRHNVNVTVNRTININRNNINRRDIRTSSWHQVNSQRSMRSGRQNGLSGNNRHISGNTALKAGTRGTAASVQTGLRQREGKAQVSQTKMERHGGQAKIRSDRHQMSGSGFSAKSGKASFVKTGKSGGKSQASFTKSSGRSNAKAARAQHSVKSRGNGGGGHGGGGHGVKAHAKHQ